MKLGTIDVRIYTTRAVFFCANSKSISPENFTESIFARKKSITSKLQNSRCALERVLYLHSMDSS